MVKLGIWAAALFMSTVLFVGCSDSPESLSLAPTPEAAVDGIWTLEGNVTGGTLVPVGSRFTLVMNISQLGNGMTGTVQSENGMRRPMTGTVDGQDLTFRITQGKPCAGTFSGSGTAMNGNTKLIGSYSGSDCNGSLTAEFTAGRGGRIEPPRISEISLLSE